jgi:hypothetical protein
MHRTRHRRRRAGRRRTHRPWFGGSAPSVAAAQRSFIADQIAGYDSKRYTPDALAAVADPKIFMVSVRNNAFEFGPVMPEFLRDRHSVHRIREVAALLDRLLAAYTVRDTAFLMNVGDTYYSKTDAPVFNYAVPGGKPGLIFPTFDVLNIYAAPRDADAVVTGRAAAAMPVEGIDAFAALADKYTPKRPAQYKGKQSVRPDVYFVGADSSSRATRIRRALARERLPLNIRILQDADPRQPMETLKDHKYLLDLPGWKPWSVRMKFLFLLDRVPIRVSLFDPAAGETSFLKQYFDYVFVEGEDYVHLVYECNYLERMPAAAIKAVANDVRAVHAAFERDPEKYRAMVAAMNRKRAALSEAHMLEYLYDLLEAYTEKVLDA